MVNADKEYNTCGQLYLCVVCPTHDMPQLYSNTCRSRRGPVIIMLDLDLNDYHLSYSA